MTRLLNAMKLFSKKIQALLLTTSFDASCFYGYISGIKPPTRVEAQSIPISVGSVDRMLPLGGHSFAGCRSW